jgi:hypothetical protein
MNLFSPALIELSTGDLLVAWGGRRVGRVSQSVGGIGTSGRDEYQTGPIVLTHIKPGAFTREDYSVMRSGAHLPALFQDTSGRVYLAVQQQPYFTEAGGWVFPVSPSARVSRGLDFTAPEFAPSPTWPWSWGIQPTFDTPRRAYSRYTANRLTGVITHHGYQAADPDNGLTGYSDVIRDGCGRQLRVAPTRAVPDPKNVGSPVMASAGSAWAANTAREIAAVAGFAPDLPAPYPVALAQAMGGLLYAAWVDYDLGEIPWRVERVGAGVLTADLPDTTAGAEQQAEYAAAWDADNQRDAVMASPDASIYQPARDYANPIGWRDQRPGYLIGRDGRHWIAWVHGNLAAIERTTETGFDAVGLRVAVSGDGGRTFRPFIPARVGGLVFSTFTAQPGDEPF